jgi:hypothetical protein
MSWFKKNPQASAKDIYFHVVSTPDGVCALLCPINFFTKEGCMYDQHLGIESLLPEYLHEDMECLFFSNKTIEETRQDLLAKNFVELNEYSEFCDLAFDVVGEIMNGYPELDTWLTDPLTNEELECIKKADTEQGEPW